jgi:hypothetical protein
MWQMNLNRWPFLLVPFRIIAQSHWNADGNEFLLHNSPIKHKISHGSVKANDALLTKHPKLWIYLCHLYNKVLSIFLMIDQVSAPRGVCSFEVVWMFLGADNKTIVCCLLLPSVT